MRRSFVVALGLGILVGVAATPGCFGRSCEPLELAAVDYADDASWICRPGRDDVCSRPRTIFTVGADGAVTRSEEGPAAADPPIDCFYVYPTVDLRVRYGVHEDLEDLEDERRTTTIQAARFSEVCRVYAPAYRQVTLGTYIAGESRRDPCFEVAYSDVAAAFDHYLEHDNQGRGFVIVGHSQGGQHSSRLIREKIDGDPALRARMIAALPLGWLLGTAAGEAVGGSFENIPICQGADEVGCVVGFRSFHSGEELPDVSDDYREGASIVCANPASPDDAGAWARLAGPTLPADAAMLQRPEGVPDDEDVFIRIPDAYEARCVDGEGGGRALEVRWGPAAGDARSEILDLSGTLLAGDSGTHIYDMQWAQADLIVDVDRRTKAWLASQGP